MCDEPTPAVSPFSAEVAQMHQRAWAKHLAQPVEITNSVGMKLMLIPAGQFTMGSPPGEQGRSDAEAQHIVKLTKAFYLGAAEVTQGQWQALMGKNPSFVTGDSLPVDTVTWADAVEFCRKLSEKEQGAQYRLPTEAEWEYACRAGTETPFHTGATITTAQANYHGGYTYGSGRKGEFRETSTAAGTFAANPWGLYDMHGNVWEWCADWYGDYPGGEATNPTGPGEGTRRVVRGGCWINFPAVCRSANRGGTVPESWSFHFSFRVVRVVE
jgi:formylglycine-generating enzyme required for sulfatase activity